MKVTQTDLLTSKLPAELVVDTFSRVVPPKRREKWSESSPPHATLTPFFLGEICHPWRSVVWSTPVLWTYVTLTLNREHYETQVELLRGWLDRSSHHPLTIIMRGPGGDEEEDWEINPPHEIMRQLAAVSERWKEVDMFISYPCYKDLACVRSRLPLLERLTIRPPDGVDSVFDRKLDFFHDAPKLQDLTINELYYSDAPALPWHQLKYLYGQDFSGDDCFGMLADAQELVVGRFNHVLQLSDFAYPSHELIHMPHLQILELSAIGNMLAIVFLDSLSLPALVELELRLGFRFEDWKDFSISHLTSLILRSGCSLQKLSLFKIRLVEDELIECLVCAPQLVELHIHAEYPKPSDSVGTGRCISDTFLFGLSPPGSRPSLGVDHVVPIGQDLVPDLQVLKYSGPLAITPRTLRTMLEYRWYGASHPSTSTSSESSSSRTRLVSRLHKVSFESANSIPLTPEVRSALRSLIVDEGMDLLIATNGYDVGNHLLPIPDPGPTVLRTSGGTGTETSLDWVPGNSTSSRHDGVARQTCHANINGAPSSSPAAAPASASPSPPGYPGPLGMSSAHLWDSENWWYPV